MATRPSRTSRSDGSAVSAAIASSRRLDSTSRLRASLSAATCASRSARHAVIASSSDRIASSLLAAVSARSFASATLRREASRSDCASRRRKAWSLKQARRRFAVWISKSRASRARLAEARASFRRDSCTLRSASCVRSGRSNCETLVNRSRFRSDATDASRWRRSWTSRLPSCFWGTKHEFNRASDVRPPSSMMMRRLTGETDVTRSPSPLPRRT